MIVEETSTSFPAVCGKLVGKSILDR